MIIVKRYFDDAYGKVHTVHRETFRNLVPEDCKLDIPPITTSDDLKSYLRKYRLVSKLGKWIPQNLAQTHAYMDPIANPEGYGDKTEV